MAGLDGRQDSCPKQCKYVNMTMMIIINVKNIATPSCWAVETGHRDVLCGMAFRGHRGVLCGKAFRSAYHMSVCVLVLIMMTKMMMVMMLLLLL